MSVRVAFSEVVALTTASFSTVTLEIKAQWHNAENPLDVDDDGDVKMLDLLRIINLLTEHGSRALEQFDQHVADDVLESLDVDINKDEQITPQDAL